MIRKEIELIMNFSNYNQVEKHSFRINNSAIDVTRSVWINLLVHGKDSSCELYAMG